MEESAGGNRVGLAAAIALLIGVLIALAALLNLGPFAEDELSEAKFLARGDEICTEAHDRFDEVQNHPPRTAPEAASLTRDLIEIAEEELKEIRKLEVPQALASPLRRYLSSRERGVEVMKEGLAAAEEEDAFGYADAQARVAGEQLDRLQLAREIGFHECSRPLIDRQELEQQSEPPVSADPSAPPTVNNRPTGG